MIQVRAFVAAATVGSFTAGAATLGLTQSALSRCIKELESALEVTLFVRSRKGVLLSDIGCAVLPHATQLLARHADVVAGMATWQASRRKELCVAGSYAVMPIVLPTLLRMLNQEFGDARVQMEEVASDVVVRRVLSGDASIGVGAVLCEHPELRYTPLLEAQFGLIVARDFVLPPNILSLNDLRDVPFVRYTDNALITTALKAHGVEFDAYFRSRVVVDGVGYAYGLAREGKMAALITGIGAGRNKDGAMRFVPLPGLLPCLTISLFTRRDSAFDAHQEVMKDLIADSVLNTTWHPSVRLLHRASGGRKAERSNRAAGDEMGPHVLAKPAPANIGFREIRVFLAVAHGGNITQAAHQLHITPSGLSKVIRDLEAQLGAQLFARSSQGVTLTEAGAALFASAQRLSDCVEETLTRLRAIKAESQGVVQHARLKAEDQVKHTPKAVTGKGEATAGVTGPDSSGFRVFGSLPQHVDTASADSGVAGASAGSIRISVGTLLAREMMSEWLANYVVTHPGVTLHLLISDDRPDLVQEGIDLALRPGFLTDPAYGGRLLSPAYRVACASPAYLRRMGVPSHPKELAQHHCLVHRSQNRWLNEWEFSLARRQGSDPLRIKVGCTLHCDNASVAYEWALQGRGIIYNSELALKRALASGSLVRLFEGYVGVPAPLYAVHASGNPWRPHVQHLVEQLVMDFGGNGVGR